MVAWTATEQQKYGVAIHNWHGEVRYGLPLDVGDSVEILEEYGDWFRGLYLRKPRTVGIFPKAYVHLKEVKTDPVVTECTLVLREWAEIWKRLFVERETYKFTTLRKVMLSLLESRRELLGSTLTHDQTLELQLKIVSKVDWGNRLQCLCRTGDPNARNGGPCRPLREYGSCKSFSPLAHSYYLGN